MNKSKIKGTAYETAVVRHLNDNGFPYAERRALAGNLDKGDIAGIPSVVMECKAEQRIDLSGYMDEVATEKRNAAAQVGVAIVKRRNHGVGRSYVVLELDDFLELIR
jgi:Holliday junction resolvase